MIVKPDNNGNQMKKASLWEIIKFKYLDLFSGTPKLTFKVDKENHKIKIEVFDAHCKLMTFLALLFLIMWGFLLFKAISANNPILTVIFGVMEIICLIASILIFRNIYLYEAQIVGYINMLAEHKDIAEQMFSGMINQSPEKIKSALKRISPSRDLYVERDQANKKSAEKSKDESDK